MSVRVNVSLIFGQRVVIVIVGQIFMKNIGFIKLSDELANSLLEASLDKLVDTKTCWNQASGKEGLTFNDSGFMLRYGYF